MWDMLSDLEKAQELDQQTIADLKEKINILNQIIADKGKYIENQEKLHTIELATEKEKNNRRFGIGIVGGYGPVTNSTGDTFQGFIGVGISYDLFRF